MPSALISNRQTPVISIDSTSARHRLAPSVLTSVGRREPAFARGILVPTGKRLEGWIPAKHARAISVRQDGSVRVMTRRLVTGELELLDWRRQVAELYSAVRAESDPSSGHAMWRVGRDHLFRTHPQSPLPAEDPLRRTGLPYWPYDPRCGSSSRYCPHERPAGGWAYPRVMKTAPPWC